MNNNMLMLLLPFLMNGKSPDMSGVLKEVLKSQQGAMNPMTLLLLTMLTNQSSSSKEKEGAEAVKGFGGEDVLSMLKILLQNKSV